VNKRKPVGLSFNYEQRIHTHFSPGGLANGY
jgi:hypothetical protein